MDNDEQISMVSALQTHVQRLAGDIGERNVFHPAALNDAASYIESEWNREGYTVSRLAYEVSGSRCANLQVTRSGNARRREILLIGRTMTQCWEVRALTTMRAVLLQCLKYPVSLLRSSPP